MKPIIFQAKDFKTSDGEVDKQKLNNEFEKNLVNVKSFEIPNNSLISSSSMFPQSDLQLEIISIFDKYCSNRKNEINIPDPTVYYKFYDFEGAYKTIVGQEGVSTVRFNYACCDFNDLEEGNIPIISDPSYKYFSELSKRFLVLCLTTSYNNLLMWAHYAQNWNGVVLGFYIKDKVKFLKNLTHLNVKYLSDSSSVESFLSQYNFKTNHVSNGQNINVLPLILNLLSSKYIAWEYEKEIRLVTFPEELKNKELSIPMVEDYIRSHKGQESRLKRLDDIGLGISSVYLGHRLKQNIDNSFGEQNNKATDYLEFYKAVLSIPQVRVYSCSSTYMSGDIIRKDVSEI